MERRRMGRKLGAAEPDGCAFWRWGSQVRADTKLLAATPAVRTIGAAVAWAWMVTGAESRWNAVSSRSTCGNTKISRITANKPSRMKRPPGLIVQFLIARQISSVRSPRSTAIWLRIEYFRVGSNPPDLDAAEPWAALASCPLYPPEVVGTLPWLPDAEPWASASLRLRQDP
jgi:hypothetical protein